jgi:hypothetical protein
VTARELLATLRRSGIELTVHGGRLRVEAPRGAVTPELRRELREHKPELIAELSCLTGWPPESLDAERSFGAPCARLYPFLGRTVETPAGPGRLLQVFSERAAVLLDGDERVSHFLPAELRPPGAASDLETHEPRLH